MLFWLFLERLQLLEGGLKWKKKRKMELIRKTRTETTKNGNKIRYAIFKCLGCLQEVEKEISGGKRDKSCVCCKEKLISEKAKERYKNPENHPNFGKKFTKERRQKMLETRIKKELSKGENNPNWQNGISFEIYSQEFNKELKQSILERDNYTCQCPDCNLENGRLLVKTKDNILQNFTKRYKVKLYKKINKRLR